MANTTLEADVVELPATDGVAFVEQSSPLTRLHYFDGQFLRAASLTTEQDYHRHALQRANLAGGWGLVNGFGIALAGDSLAVSPGLGVTPNGQLVLASTEMKARLTDLLATAKPPSPGGKAAFEACLEAKPPAATASVGLQIYEITVGPIEGLCGNEPVFGKLCETACASDSRRPYWREGVVLRLRPVPLDLPQSISVPAAQAHLRNRIASAYFGRELGQPPSLLSAAGLASGVWCEPAQPYHRDELVIGLLWRDAGVARVDAWSGRRERMDTQPRAYWQGRMAMRPWNVFTAQILQFQCQLSGLFDAASPVLTPQDDCERIREALSHTRREIEDLLKRFEASSKGLVLKSGERESIKRLQSASAAFKSSYADLAGLSGKLAGIGVDGSALPKKRMLINAGFLDLPPAGYLPVSPGSDVRPQCERMFGEGVALHFHAVRPDEIAHLVEEAAHLDRISLTRGLDDTAQVEHVEVFVPAGQVTRGAAKAAGAWWEVQMAVEAFELMESFFRGAGKQTDHGLVIGAVPVQPAAGDPQVEPANTDPADPQAAATERPAPSLSLMREHMMPDAVSSRKRLQGLMRTESREDGSFGFALVVGFESPAEVAVRIPGDMEFAAYSNEFSQERRQIAFYISGDIARDPFDLPIGGSARLEAEFLNAENVDCFQAQGRLTLLRQIANADGRERRVVQIDFRATEDERSKMGRIRLQLQRDTQGRRSVFVLDDERQDPESSPVFITWSDQPRHARLGVDVTKKDRMTADTVPLVDMAGLPDMPPLGSDLATEALNRLAAIAEATDDAAFLLRARQRLLPTIDMPKTETVLTAADWVMFRRARTHLCGPACTAAPATTVETFQVWHLRLDNDERLTVVREAIDRGDAEVLATFKFTRVGLLRYRDESALCEESDAQVLAMWRAANPATRVVLGRVWEIAPATGQGWQNHMRLRRMLETIDPLTKAPRVGEGSITVAAPPPGTLGDRATDGGMLVVTFSAAKIEQHNHRVVMLPIGSYDDLAPVFQKYPKDALTALEGLVGRPEVVTRDVDARFTQGQLAAADATALHVADEEMRKASNGSIAQVRQLLVTLPVVDAPVQPKPEHEIIVKLLNLDAAPGPNGPNDGDVVAADVTDLGRGAQVLTLLGYVPQAIE